MAKILGGKRSPGSGALIPGSGDILPPALFQDFCIEVKRRKTLPGVVTAYLRQAEASIGVGDLRKPMAVYRDDGGQWMVSLYLEHFVDYAKALADTGSGYTARPFLDQIDRCVDQLRKIFAR